MLMSLQPSKFLLSFFLQVRLNFLSISLRLPWRWDLFYGRMVSWQKWFQRILHLMWQEVPFSRCNAHQAVVLLPAVFIYRTVVARQFLKNNVIPAGHCNQAGCYSKTAAQSRGGNENSNVTLVDQGAFCVTRRWKPTVCRHVHSHQKWTYVLKMNPLS